MIIQTSLVRRKIQTSQRPWTKQSANTRDHGFQGRRHWFYGLMHGICCCWLLSAFYAAKTWRYANCVPFRSFQAAVDTFIAVSWNYITRYVNFQGLFPWSSIYQLKTRERITFFHVHPIARLTTYSRKIRTECARRIEVLQFLVFVLKLFHDFDSCCICVGLTVFIVFRQARLCVSLIVAFCSMF